MNDSCKYLRLLLIELVRAIYSENVPNLQEVLADFGDMGRRFCGQTKCDNIFHSISISDFTWLGLSSSLDILGNDCNCSNYTVLNRSITGSSSLIIRNILLLC